MYVPRRAHAPRSSRNARQEPTDRTLSPPRRCKAWALCPAWFPKDAQAARHIVHVRETTGDSQTHAVIASKTSNEACEREIRRSQVQLPTGRAGTAGSAGRQGGCSRQAVRVPVLTWKTCRQHARPRGGPDRRSKTSQAARHALYVAVRAPARP